MVVKRFALASMLGLVMCTAIAQPAPPIAERIMEIGAVLNPKMVEEMFSLYAPLMPKAAGAVVKEDVAAALRWVKENIRDYGGDPARIVLYGQSAGATHVAHYIFDEALQPQMRRTG